jgi:RNA polymerase subunit RPABC4/transcription elongation factor Spt4
MKKKECPSCAMEVDIKAKVCPVCKYEFPSIPVWISVLAILLLLVILLFWVLKV